MYLLRWGLFFLQISFSQYLYAVNVSCNYATTTSSATTCVVENEQYSGFARVEVEAKYENTFAEMPELGTKPKPGSYTAVVTWHDGTVYHLNSSEVENSIFRMFLPECRTYIPQNDTAICSIFNSPGSPTTSYVFNFSYSCEHSSDCYTGIIYAKQTLVTASSSSITVPGENAASYSLHSHASDDGDLVHCDVSSTVTNNIGRTVQTCTPLPLGAFFVLRGPDPISTLPPGIGASHGVITDTVSIESVNLVNNIKKDIPFIITYPQATCQDAAMYESMGSYVFEKNRTTSYTAHLPVGINSITVQLVPKKSLSECSHNIFSSPGNDPYAKNYYKINLIDSSSTCTDGVSSETDVKTSDNHIDTVIDWTITGLSSFSAGTEIKCTHNLVTELTWY